ncbi:sensor histidine kinase [Ruegeria sp. 2205SS24-7]|uniref:sensor histidine kinase n=1 Tax=Ruegeria discodermiae TaxID=3064389 RepID=UPI0027421963|nr:sensor histidine kinase [Ruegeria sp. 2205SS24-7]MDP5219188.1 sensor histidine kinase [Ruegeria sp. 2205SS24-7]
MRRASLRLRLFVLILSPLVLMAVLLGYWRFTVAQNTAEDLFDRSLLAAALAISRDVAVSGGDALAPSTRDLIRDAAGGEVFYHATGPGGIYITGYAYPPKSDNSGGTDIYAPHFFGATYRDEDVRVLSVRERVTIENLTGDASVKVWQRIEDRQNFARQLAIRAAALIGTLLATLALVVWFGVARGLRPLIDLQDAIAARSPNDLSQIRRPVPIEVSGIVRTLNRLFSKVEASMTAHQVFISDAAHQLRNPAAAVQSMAEAVRDAPSAKERNKRISELVSAARSSARVADQLLSLDRLQQSAMAPELEPVDLREIVEDICAEFGPTILSRGIEFEFNAPDQPTRISGDRLFLTEAVKNLIDNALKHGGPDLTQISVAITHSIGEAIVTIKDDGKGLKPEQSETAFGRFSQVEPSDGSGLGLAIAMSVAERHGGALVIDRAKKGASISLHIPKL